MNFSDYLCNIDSLGVGVSVGGEVLGTISVSSSGLSYMF